MNAHTPVRGGHLVKGAKVIAAGTGWIGRVLSGPFQRLVDRIDARLEHGSMQAALPDGSHRMLGGRGEGPAAIIELHDWRALVRLATGGSVGWYQAWEAGEWSSPDPVQIFALFMRNAGTLGDVARAKGPWRLAVRLLHRTRANSRRRAALNISAHYDLGNDFYAAWLDPTMSYSSALWAGIAPDAPLAEAQANKVGRLAARLQLQPEARVLEIGCGWGYLATRLAQDYGAQVTAISLSDEQLDWARRMQSADGGPVIDFRHQDYRDVVGTFDAIASVEMVEAVGREYWPAFVDCVAQRLKPGGRAALQFISIRDDLFDAYAASADFIQTFVFPGGMLVRDSELRKLAADCGLDWHDQHDFGADYARTLAQWRIAFDAAVDEGRLPAGFDARFVRLWQYYLMYCEGGFAGGGIDVSQVTLVRRG
ncbi:SAM-dependent methyltransferase [Novosphingobium lentum]|uniref:SAM-dependent methyltransferase n=1 Tax=Novosphingobium lentum TaxID=145287 RepID=UPI0008340338|nr:cyclopropane-fatty-acyl-phospholipid synthase family protein [Novosphingobium lentum]